MGWFDWLNPKEEIEEDEELEENLNQERLREDKWIKIVFSLSLENEKEFYKNIEIIEKHSGWKAKEDFNKLKKSGTTTFQVGGSFSINEFLKIKSKVLNAKKNISKSNKEPFWYVDETSNYTGNRLNGTFYNLIEVFDVDKSLMSPLLSFRFFLEKLQDLNKKDKKLVREILGTDLEEIKLKNTNSGMIMN